MDARRRQAVTLEQSLHLSQHIFTTSIATAAKDAQRMTCIASHKDMVLKTAFQLGDPISNALHDDHQFFRAGARL